MSITATILPILAALSVAQEKLNLSDWTPVNAQQSVLMEKYYPKRVDLQKLLPQELASCASQDFDEVNKFLKDRGFDIQLDKTQAEGANSLAVASILDIALQWKIAGEKSTIEAAGYKGLPEERSKPFIGKQFPAVRMKEGYTVRSLGNSSQNVIAIECTNGDTVYMTRADEKREGFELVEHVQSLSKQSFTKSTNTFSGILFPVVDINQKVDIRWLCKLCAVENGAPQNLWRIAEALQQTKFHMDELGARIQSAVAIHAIKECCEEKPVLEMNGPFYLWIERPGMKLPLFAAYIDYSDLKEIGQKS